MTHIEYVDVLIIGSGPSGMSTALHLVQQDPGWSKRLIVVDKAVHPREKLCGGGVTHLGMNVLAGLGLAFEPPHFSVREARLVYEDLSYSFYANPAIRITRRDVFDHWLVQVGEERGIDVRQGEGVTDVTVHEGYVEVHTEKDVYHARVVVAADGSRSFVRSRLQWDDQSRVARLLEVLTPEEPRQQMEFRDGVAVFDFTPMQDKLQGYYWDFPSFVDERPFMNRGVFDSRARPERERADLKQVLGEALAARDRDLGACQLKGHPIRWFDKNGRFAIPRVLLVGDAAGADPLMGEGIAFALGYGQVAAAAIADAFASQDFSFATYRERLLATPLFQHLRLRARLARVAYLLNYRWLARFGWRVMGFLVRFSRWRDPDYRPGTSVEQLSNRADSTA